MSRRPDLTHITRRGFLRAAGATAGGLLVPGLRALPAAARDDQPRPVVALAQAASYDRAVIRTQVQAMLDALGGLDDVVRPGDRVAIKTNLTGGTWFQSQIDAPATERYVTHPEVVRALGEAVLDAGAAELFIVEAVTDQESWEMWGHSEVAEDLGATLIDLNSPRPQRRFVEQPVGEDALIYKAFMLHTLLADIDVFMSVAKMKCHKSAGITLAMKNLVGIVPLDYYHLGEDGYRSALHGPGDEYQTRLPRVIVDLNRARPIHLALIDGVMTTEGGEGPWITGCMPVEAGVLVAGKNAVATDAVAAAVMGFDPETESRAADPFRYCDNHLQLASEAGLGPHTLADIDIVGAALDDVCTPFQPFNPSQEDAQTRRLRYPVPHARTARHHDDPHT